MSSNPLSLDFLIKKPVTAAQVLQSQEPEAVAGYLKDVPVRVLVPLIEAMESWPAARLLALLPLRIASALTIRLSYPVAATLLRLQDEDRRQAILETLPGTLARSISRTLSYADTSVGAWMDSAAAHFSPDITVTACIKLIKHSRHSVGCLLTVIDAKHSIAGVIETDKLLVAGEHLTLRQLMDTAVEPLPAQMSLSIADNSKLWHRYNNLPVRDSGGSFVGTISRAKLQEARDRSRNEQQIDLGSSLGAHLFRAMSVTTRGLVALLASDSSRVQDRHDSN